ncbi:hypothetical protein BJX63DRAFT_403325 [Aspergillus granulosus]|uniref:Phosphoglycerate mutase family protein n=1 Tax=Aspergillus granulosus TaxID=176169 RepID=A0ABR4H3K2_9EURO
MGKSPAAIFIARHGARLDAANKDWHLTSATPYDPPLSYGGWLQSRALGARIVNELRSLEDQLDRSPQGTKGVKIHSQSPQDRKSKRKIIIHTSPFLRCVQTAIAISSGISQNYADIDSLRPRRPPSSDQSNGTTAASESASSLDSNPQNSQQCLLRVDACLGEWLNPGYFENIIPPPKSERMVATAKMELLRRDTGIIPAADTQNKPSVGHFPGGWGNLVSIPGEEDRGSDSESASGIVRRASQRNRAGSYDSLRRADTPLGRKMLKLNTELPSIPDMAYIPPVPSYAIASSSPIPDGYVTHARDACVLVDYQWDSMREPQNWGNGGEYGEEWSTMHGRFRNGLERMIQWYRNDNAPVAPSHRRTRSQLQFLEQDEGDDSSSDVILIIVTHGAGCNALIGALMGGPAFVDVNTASLTLALRKDCVKEPVKDAEKSKPSEVLSNASGFEDYRLVEVASTDHLRPGTSPTTSVRSPSISSLPSPSIPSYRQRFPSRASFSSGPVILGPSLKSGLQSWNMPRASSGLWNSISGDEEAVEDLVPDFGTPLSTSSSMQSNDMADSTLASKVGGSTWSAQLPQRTLSQRGLWGSAPLNKERQISSNRRWTVAERPL